MLNSTVSPIFLAASSPIKAPAELTDFPLTATTTSFACIPALAAGPFSITFAISTPFVDLILSALTFSESKLFKYTPMYGFSNFPVEIIESLTTETKFDGIANPNPTLPPEVDKMAVLTPITLPLMSINGPPLFP